MIAYIARDKDGQLYLYQEKPIKCEDDWIPKNSSISSMVMAMGINSVKEFDKVKWEDEHPTKIEIKIKK